MIQGEPLPDGGLLRKGVIYLVPATGSRSGRDVDPRIVAAIEREQRRRIREYLEARRRAS